MTQPTLSRVHCSPETEEASMLERFGDEYREYRRRVRLFIPRLDGVHPEDA